MATITGIKAGTTVITASYGGVTSNPVNFTVNALTATLTFTSSGTLTYNGQRRSIGTIHYTGDGTAYYYVQKATSQPSTPSASASGWVAASDGDDVFATASGTASGAGTYYVFLKSTAGTGYAAINPKQGGSTTINKRTVTCTVPTVKTDTIRYTGSAQNLLSGLGSASDGGAMYYYVSTSSTTPTFSTSTWSTDQPTGTNVGTYYIWYYVYIADTNNNQAGTNVGTVKSLGSKAIEKRNGAAPTFSASSVTATCTQGSNASTSPAVNASAFTAATAKHSGSITYSIQGVVKNGSNTQLSGWSMTSTTSRVITVPANTLPATYKVTVRATEAATSTDTESYTDAVITVTLSKGAQSLSIDNTTLTLTYPTTGTITASGYVGTLSSTSGTTSVATVSTDTSTKKVTVTPVANGTSTVTVKAAATDYLTEVTKTCAVTVNRRTGAEPTFGASTVTATCSQDQSAKTTTAFTAATAGHGGTITYDLGTVKNSSNVTQTDWTLNSGRTFTIPANTPAGTYTVSVTANEAQTSTDTASSKTATITVTLSKGTQSLTLTSSPTNATTTYPTGGTITASGHTGTISVTSATQTVATASASGSTVTVTAVGQGTSVISVTAAENDYVNSVTKTVNWTVNRRTGAAPTFADGSVSATLVQAGSARTTTAFTAATAGHSGTLSYTLGTVTKSGSSTALSGWTLTSSTRKINVPANTAYGTYYATVTANEAATSTDTASSASATITITLNRGTQTLTLDKDTLTLTVPNTGTITASGYAGTLTVTSGTTSVATASDEATSTITAVSAGTATITFTAAATNYVKSISKTATVTVERRTGAAPTFNNSTVTATCSQDKSAKTTSAFTAGTAGHSGTLSYELISAKNSGGTTLTGWSVDSSNRTIGIPANTKAGTYTVVVRCNEAQTSTDTASYTDATITVTLSKGAQTLNLNKTTLELQVPNTGTITASGYAGTLTVTSGTTSVATASDEATSTITAVSAGTSIITFTAAANDYVNSVSKTATVTVTRRNGAAPTFGNDSVTATCSQDQTAKTTSAFGAATAGHGGSITYSLVSAKNSGGTSLSGWSVNSTNRTIGVPANTKAGTYTVVVRATEAQTSTDTESTKDATITVTMSKGSQTLTLNKTTLSLVVPNTGTITASGYVGTLSVSSNATSVATASNAATSTITAVSNGTATITFTADANDYVNSVSKTATVTVSRREGAAPTFNNSTVTATCSQDQTAKTTSAFTAASPGHSGSITYSLVSAKNSGGTSLTGWSVNSTNRTIGVPANTKAGTYTVVVRATEAQTSTDSESTADATITVTMSKGTQSLTLTGNPSNFTSTYNSGGTITASGHVGTLSVTSGNPSVATVSKNSNTITVTCVKAGTSTITVTAAANDYVNEVIVEQDWTINKADPTLATNWKGDSKVYHNTASLTLTGYSGGTIKYRYDVNNGTSWTETTTAPTRTALGTTAVQYKIIGDANHNDSSWSSTVTLTITQAGDARMEVTTTERTYTGSAQVIASQTSGTAEGIGSYTLGYYKSTSTATADSQITWGTANTSLSATNAGTYQIYYKFTPDANHSNSNVPDSGLTTATHVGEVVINKASRSGAVSCSNTTYPTTVTATVSGNTESGTVTWGITPGSGTATINSSGVVTPTKAGTVTVTATVAATANYKAYTATSKQITISKSSAGSVSYVAVSTVSEYCTTLAQAKSKTDTTFPALTIASSPATTSTNGAITYSISPSTWTVQNSGTKIVPPENTNASTYNVTITATGASNDNYNVATSTATIAVTISAVSLSSLNLVIATSSIAYGSSTDVTSLLALYTNGASVDVKDDANTTYSAVSSSGIVSISKS